MIQAVRDVMSWALGLDAIRLTLWQMGLRAAVIYVAALVMVRLVGDRRFIGKYAALDVLLTVILGSTLSRAINGSAPFFDSLGAALVLVGMHWLFSAIAFHFEGLDTLIKGHSGFVYMNFTSRFALVRQANLDCVYVDGAAGDYSCLGSLFLTDRLLEARDLSATTKEVRTNFFAT
jgi:hypothetical protein